MIDAAKIIDFEYRYREADLEELATPFLDIQKPLCDTQGSRSTARGWFHFHPRSGTEAKSRLPFAVLTKQRTGAK